MSEPIRILQVFARMDRGGAESMIMNLYRRIDRSKVQFDFMVHTEEKCAFDEEIEQLGGKIYRVPRYNGKNHFKYIKAWKHFLSKHTEHIIVHGHVRSTASLYLYICKKDKRITIAHSHSTSSGTGIDSKIKNIMQFPIRNIANFLFACSIPAGEWLFGDRVTRNENFHVINNSIDAERFSYSEDERIKVKNEMRITNQFVVGHIGRFDAPKNHEFIIDIFREVKNMKENALLILVGDGALRKDIQEKVKHLNLSNDVIFTGIRSDIPKLLQGMDVFVFPSLYEGLGIAAIEAQAAGLPTFVSETIPQEAFITDLIKKENLNKSPDEWASKIIDNFEKHQRRNMYEEIKAAGYDINDTVKWMENFYIQQTKKYVDTNY